jgi:O-antigen ligase
VVDFLVYFAVFFYGVRTAKDSGAVLRGFLFCVTLTNICSCLDGFGILRFGMYVQLTDNRLQGFVGEHNQYGAWLVLFFPALIAQALATKNRPERLFWFGSAALSIAALLATASRGGVVAAIFGLVAGLYLFRRQISFDQIAKWAIGGAIALVGVIAAVSVRYGDMIYRRFVAKSSSVDDADVSSGRTEFWAAILQTMNEHPITYLTGYGYDVYNVMAFRKVSHNEYLTILFDLGLIGLAAFVTIIALLIREVSQAATRAERPWRAHLMAFVFGFISLATAVIFVNLYDPWPYVWAYAGLMARMALTVREAAPSRSSRQVAPVAAKRAELAPAGLDSYGWSSRRKAT